MITQTQYAKRISKKHRQNLKKRLEYNQAKIQAENNFKLGQLQAIRLKNEILSGAK